jgi:site-specific DNA-methyltransferase (adenine-specific)
VAASIKEFGWRVPIVIDKDGAVTCGHTRLLAAKKLSLQDATSIH